MTRFFIFLAWGTATLGLCGCVNSMARSSWEQLAVETDPPGAHVRLSNGADGTTPVYFGIPRNQDLKITLSKEGYQTVVIPVRSKLDAFGVSDGLLLVANPMPAGLLLVAADLATGSASSHRPNPVRVKLQPLSPAPPESPEPAGAKKPL